MYRPILKSPRKCRQSNYTADLMGCAPWVPEALVAAARDLPIGTPKRPLRSPGATHTSTRSLSAMSMCETICNKLQKGKNALFNFLWNPPFPLFTSHPYIPYYVNRYSFVCISRSTFFKYKIRVYKMNTILLKLIHPSIAILSYVFKLFKGNHSVAILVRLKNCPVH